MRDASRRLQALEIHRRRCLAAEAGAKYGFSANHILDAAIRWLEMTPEQQQADMPQFIPEELSEIRPWLPLYRRARWKGRG